MVGQLGFRKLFPANNRHPHSGAAMLFEINPTPTQFPLNFPWKSNNLLSVYCMWFIFRRISAIFHRNISMMTFIRSIERAEKNSPKIKLCKKESNHSNSIHLSQSNQYSVRRTLFHALASSGDVDVWCTYTYEYTSRRWGGIFVVILFLFLFRFFVHHQSIK